MVLGKLDGHKQKNETGPFSYTIYKNKLKGLNVRPETIKILEQAVISFTSATELLTWHVSEGKRNKNKNELLESHQDKKGLHSKGNNKEN